MKNPFIKYLMREQKEDIFHSSAYGKAQNAGAIGAASTESFEERMKVERNRKIVQGYNDSRIVNGAYMNGPKAKKYVPKEKREETLKKTVAEKNQEISKTNTTASAVKKTFAPNIKPNFGK